VIVCPCVCWVVAGVCAGGRRGRCHPILPAVCDRPPAIFGHVTDLQRPHVRWWQWQQRCCWHQWLTVELRGGGTRGWRSTHSQGSVVHGGVGGSGLGRSPVCTCSSARGLNTSFRFREMQHAYLSTLVSGLTLVFKSITGNSHCLQRPNSLSLSSSRQTMPSVVLTIGPPTTRTLFVPFMQCFMMFHPNFRTTTVPLTSIFQGVS
jgi:hypothetical protein